ncbi:MAG: Ig-like domain-containing protein [Methanobacterium sp.]|uniref:Ig-like domain-containing protein n=1 Tax=Methanobacterium sp. TaxID=2164 RepID=UPI003D92DF83
MYDPVSNSVNVPIDKVITVTFNEPIKAGNNWIELELFNGTCISVNTSIKDNKLTICPPLLAAGTKYKVVLHTGSVKDLAGNSLALVVKYFTTSSDAVGPTVKGMDPVSNSVNVPIDKVITVTFNEPIKAGNNWIELELFNGTCISVNTSIKDNKLTICPPLLAAGTKYKVVLHTGSVKDLAGNSLALVVKYFTTSSDAVGPTVKGMDPVSNSVNVPIDKVITVTFNEPIKAGNNWIELELFNGTCISVNTSIKDNKLTICPPLLAAGTKYKVVLHTGSVKDLAGNSLALVVKYFTTSSDAVGPTVKGMDPVSNSVNVPIDKVITVTFNEPIKAGNNWIELELFNGTCISVNTSIKDNKLTICPPLLAAGTKYKVVLHTGSVKDLAGNSLALVVKYFTTINPRPVYITSDNIINPTTDINRINDYSKGFN